jgi:nonribosomal peptide synthetase protein BlmVIII
MTADSLPRTSEEAPIAIIGMAGRFPGAPDVATLWRNLLGRTESITRFTADDLIGLGRDPALAFQPGFVGAEGVLDDIETFDAGFFGYSPREASVMDPQHRLSLETAWHAFEDAGSDPARSRGPVGVFFSAALSSYLIRNLVPNRELAASVGGVPLLVHNDKDFAATTIAHKLGLHGPALAVGTACSSSLVAVHLACQSLRGWECDLALAGGVSLQVPPMQGYVHDGEGIYSPDGRCRPFDAAAAGTVGGSGVGMVLLKRLDDALSDGDRIHAVILGTAVNNDGGASLGYTAPNVEGQLAAIAEAQAVAGVPADTIGMVEAHGTGTPLGDAVEVEALTQAFRRATARTRFCALGSLKANIGHLDAAAGVAGLIKAALAVRHGLIPGHPSFQQPSSLIALDTTPFYVSPETVAWDPEGTPRRAGVSSFGIGGTNAHVVIEQPPPHRREHPPRPWQLLFLSGRSPGAARSAAVALADRVGELAPEETEEVSFTLASRPGLPYRQAVVCRDGGHAREILSSEAATVLAGRVRDRKQKIVFMFPGQGAGYPGMASELCATEPAIAGPADACVELFAEYGTDLRSVLRPLPGVPDAPAGPLLTQAALFTVEYALAHALIGWGLEPSAVIGHSLGEYAAATIAGALSLPDAVRLVAARGRLHETLPPGGMLAIALPESELLPWLIGTLSLAAVNAPDNCVAAGSRAELADLADRLAQVGVGTRWLPLEHAFHSAAVEPGLAAFAEVAAEVPPGATQRQWVSTVTGDWVAPATAAGPEYWVRHMRETVRFDQGIRRLLEEDDTAFVEVGPSTTLSTLLSRHPRLRDGHMVMATQPHPSRPGRQIESLLTALGQAWVSGLLPDPAILFKDHHRLKTDCPPYPFERQRHWIDPPVTPAVPGCHPLSRLAAEAEHSIRVLDADAPVRGIDDYPGLARGLDELCTALAFRYLTDAGIDVRPGVWHDWPGLRRRLGVLPQYQRFLDYLVGMLADDDVVAREGGGIRFLGGTRPAAPDLLAAELGRSHPGFRGLLELLTRCGGSLGEALRVPGAALGVLYPGGEGDLLRRTLGEETVEFSVSARLAGVVARMAGKLAATAGRSLRVLEVGAGSGRLTSELSGTLRQGGAEYLVTDISQLFLGHLRGQAEAAGELLRTGVLDISRNPAEQGLAGQRFDLITGLDVLHAVPDAPAALAHLRTLLAPGGLVAFVETVAQDRWLSMVWGLADDWWSFSDAFREHTPLLPQQAWAALMAAQDFAATAVVPGRAEPGTADAALILAQAPAHVGSGDHDPGVLADLPPKRADISSWGYLPVWQRTGPVPATASKPGAACLAFAEGSTGEAVVARLRDLGLPVAVVRPGKSSGLSPDLRTGDGWTLAPDRPQDYPEIIDQVISQHGLPRFVLHLWNASPAPAGERLDLAQEAQQRGLFSLISLARALADRAGERPVRLLAVTSQAQEVLGGDLLAPERSTVHAAAKVIGVEYPDVSCSSLDIPVATPGTAEAAWLADRIADELLSEPAAAIAAYRGRSRWQPYFSDWPLSPPGPAPQPAEPGGVYLICGGLGGIGLSLASYLGQLPARLVLIRRTPFPGRPEWAAWLASHPAGDRTSSAIRRLLDIEAAGGEILIMQADVTSLDDMRAVVARASECFGPITGVIHAAGVRDTAGVIQRRSLERSWEAISAKVRGTLVLEDVLRGQRPRFLVLCSSIGATLHKLKFGEVGYVAGNEFLNAYAAYRAARGEPGTVAIAWTDWLEAGMWADARDDLAQRYAVTPGQGYDPADDLLRGITTAEGIEAFRRVLGGPPVPQVVISTQDLRALLARQAGFSHDDRARALDSLQLADARQRPEPDSAYAAPRSDQEQAVAGIWASVLGIDKIGVHDDFFALGGDSLLALRLLARMREDAGVDATIADLFKTPTIAGVVAGRDSGPPVIGAPPGGTEEVVIL